VLKIGWIIPVDEIKTDRWPENDHAKYNQQAALPACAMALKQIEHGWIPQTTDDKKTKSDQQTKCRRNFTCLASK
jgi:hypothetical protein